MAPAAAPEAASHDWEDAATGAERLGLAVAGGGRQPNRLSGSKRHWAAQDGPASWRQRLGWPAGTSANVPTGLPRDAAAAGQPAAAASEAPAAPSSSSTMQRLAIDPDLWARALAGGTPRQREQLQIARNATEELLAMPSDIPAEPGGSSTIQQPAVEQAPRLQSQAKQDRPAAFDAMAWELEDPALWARQAAICVSAGVILLCRLLEQQQADFTRQGLRERSGAAPSASVVRRACIPQQGYMRVIATCWKRSCFIIKQLPFAILCMAPVLCSLPTVKVSPAAASLPQLWLSAGAVCSQTAANWSQFELSSRHWLSTLPRMVETLLGRQLPLAHQQQLVRPQVVPQGEVLAPQQLSRLLPCS